MPSSVDSEKSEGGETGVDGATGGANPTDRVLRSQLKWQVAKLSDSKGPRPFDVFTEHEWIDLVANQPKTPAGIRDKFDSTINIFKCTYEKEAEPRFDARRDLEGVAIELEQKYAIIMMLYNRLPNPQEADLKRIRKVELNIASARDHQISLEQARTDREANNTYYGDGDEQEMFETRDGPLDVRSVEQALLEYCSNPNDPKYRLERKEILRGNPPGTKVERIRRYLIDCALNRTLSPHNEQEFAQLLTEFPVQELLHIWKIRYHDGHTDLTEAIENALTHIHTGMAPQPITTLVTSPMTIVSSPPTQLFTSPTIRPTHVSPLNSTMGQQDIPPSVTAITPTSVTVTTSVPIMSTSLMPSAYTSNTATNTHWVFSPRRSTRETPFLPTRGDSFTTPTRSMGGVPRSTYQLPPQGMAHGQATQSPTTAEVLYQTVSLLKEVQGQRNSQQESAGCRLPAIEITLYDGNPLNFIAWWGRFESVIHNRTDLEDSKKLIYLQQYISRHAQEKCWGENVDTLEYSSALTAVLQTFANPQLMANLYLDKLQEQRFPSDENDIKGIRLFVNTTKRMISCLNRVGIQPMEYNRLVMQKFMGRVPLNLQMKMAEKLGKKISETTLAEFIQGLDDYCTAREDVTSYMEYKTQSTSNFSRFSPNPSQGHNITMLSRQQYDPNGGYKACIFCQHRGGLNGHKWKNCPTTNGRERYKIFRDLGLCLACGSNRHRVKDCVSDRRCQENVGENGHYEECGGHHHNSLHSYYAIADHEQRRGRSFESQRQQGVRFNLEGTRVSETRQDQTFYQQRRDNPQDNPTNDRNQNEQQQSAPNAVQNREASEMSQTEGTEGQQVNQSRNFHTSTEECTSIKDKCVVMGVLKARMEHPGRPRRSMDGNIYLDGGSNRSYITKDSAQRLGLPILTKTQTDLETFGGVVKRVIHPVTQVRLKGRKGQALLEVEVVDTISKPMATKQWKSIAYKTFPQYSFPAFEDDPLKIDVLIGMDHLADLGITEVERDEKLSVRNTILGVFLEGYSRKSNKDGEIIGRTTLTTSVENGQTADYDIDFDWDKAQELLENYFEQSDFSAAEDQQNSNDEILQNFMKECKLIDTPEGPAYEVPILWKSDQSKKNLTAKGSNFNMCLAFLHKLQERLKEKGILEEANAVIENAISKGFYEEVTTDPSIGVHIPTFFVKQPHSNTTPLRHVLGANMGKPPINSELQIGPSLLTSLPTVLRRFRTGKTGLSADISKAYHALYIRERDRDYMRILWIRNGKIITLRLARVPFGTCLAPFQLFATLFKHLSTHENPQGKDMIPELYSDNLVAAKDTAALNYAINAIAILGEGGFNLRKWSSNDKQIESKLPESLLNNEEHTRILGMNWSLEDDTLSLGQVNEPRKEDITRKVILKQLLKHWDPLGLASAVTMPGQAFMSQLIAKGYKWDQVLDKEDISRWNEIYAEVVEVTKNLKIPRYHEFDKERPVSLHVYCDAAQVGWGAAVGYLAQDGRAVLISTKTKMPAKRLRDAGISTPRAELEAAVIAAKEMSTLVKTYKDIYKLECHLHSDSTIVLHQIASNKPQDRFVSNRVNLIRKLVPEVPWHHVETHENPADCVSRGMTAANMLNPAHILWVGPGSMHLNLKPFVPEEDVLTSITLSTLSTDPAPSVFNLFNISEMQTLAELKHKLATIIKFSRIWCKKEPLHPRALYKDVTMRLIKAEQAITIPDELEYLKSRKGPRPPLVQPLSLFMMNGICRVGGRLGLANLKFASRFPIYLTANSPLLRLRVMEHHIIAMHSGPGVTRAKLMREYWIPKSSRIIRNIIRQCYKCRRAKGPPFRSPRSPNLPPERVNITTPYQVIGADLTGHFMVNTEKGVEKVYICLFSDTASRHINVELMEDMSTKSFLCALRRHAATYSTPQKIISDRATYFIKSAEVLGSQLGEEFCSTVSEALGKRGITWQLNPAAAPNWGGHYERLIGLIKSLLKRCIGRDLMEKDEFHTIIKEAATVANSRILAVDNPSSHIDRLPITPNHLIHGREISAIPYGEGNLDEDEDPTFDPTDNEILMQWRKLAARMKYFREQFAEEYLENLRRRHQNEQRADPVEVPKIGIGDLVLVKHNEIKRQLWDLAIVHEILPSSDGKTRAVIIRTKNGLITRPIHKLYPIMSAEQLHKGEPLFTEHFNQIDGQDQDRHEHPTGQETPPAEIPDNNAETETPANPNFRSPSVNRPVRQAARAGRERVQQWSSDLLNDST